MFAKSVVCRCLIPALGTLLLTATPMSLTTAQQNNQTDSANERINFSGKLRMLSQRAAAAACNLSAGVNEDKSRQILTLTSAEFGKLLDALENGNSDLKINGKETNDAVLSALQVVNEQWPEFDNAVNMLVNGSTSSDDIDLINTQNMPLLASAQSLVDSVVEFYSSRSSADDGFGKAIDIAGRQRMLTQKMSKEACQIWSGQDSDENVKSLEQTMNLFEQSLVGLRTGADGLIEPPDENIEQELNLVWEQWTDKKPKLEKAIAGQSLETDARAALSQELNDMLRNMNSVVGLYTVADKERGNIDDEGASERVNFSGKLRMLSQRIAAAACNYSAGVNTDQSRATLMSARAEFDKILRALEFGDADLRIRGEEKRRKTNEALAAVRDEWKQLNAAVNSILKNDNVEDNLALIEKQNMPLLSAAQLLVSEISGEYSDPSVMMQSDALLVDISGRQRMFTQKMSKESCLILTGQSALTEDLVGTMEIFETSLLALREGMDSVGIRAAPTAEIMYGLDEIWADWQALKPTLQKVSSGEAIELAQRGDLLQELDTILGDMNDVVGMYTIYGKTGL